MNKPLQDRVAVVTGGAQGLGAALCQRLAVEGAHIVVADINLDGATETAAAIEAQTGRRAIAARADVTNEDEVAQAVDLAIATFGRLDICVANAGVLIAEAIETFPARNGAS